MSYGENPRSSTGQAEPIAQNFFYSTTDLRVTKRLVVLLDEYTYLLYIKHILLTVQSKIHVQFSIDINEQLMLC
jgi:hypothetical protein